MSKPRKLEYFYDVLSPYSWIGFEVARCHLLAKQKRYLFYGSVQSHYHRWSQMRLDHSIGNEQ